MRLPPGVLERLGGVCTPAGSKITPNLLFHVQKHKFKYNKLVIHRVIIVKYLGN